MVFGQKMEILISAKKDTIGKSISRGADGTNFNFIASSCEEL